MFVKGLCKIITWNMLTDIETLIIYIICSGMRVMQPVNDKYGNKF